MSRPLLISDCDEVLLHMVTHFAEWIGEAHDYDFVLEEQGFANAVRERATGRPIPDHRIWPLLDAFFVGQSHRQKVVPGAVAALASIAEVADIIILTNLPDEHHKLRLRQLEAVDIHHEVVCNQGNKGPRVRELVDRLRPSAAVFVDDLPVHHRSVAEHAPEVWRLHMVAEPMVASHVPPAAEAHARIDRWSEALDWVRGCFVNGPAPTP